MKIAYVLIGLLLLCVACKTEKETPNGFKFTVIKSGDGVVAKKDEIIVFDFVMQDSKDSVWQSTYKEEMPGYIQVRDTSFMAAEDGMMQMFRMLAKGDSVDVTMPISKFFGELVKQPVPMGVDTALNISYYIQVKEILPMDKFRDYQTALFKNKQIRQEGVDTDKIAKFLAENNIKAEQDTSGVRYVIHNSAGGKKPAVENCVEVKYTGKFMEDGKIFDQSDRIGYPLYEMIPGWQIAIPKLGVGDSGTFYIPSALAYGPKGYPGAIPPNAILIFNVQLLNVGDSVDMENRTCITKKIN